MIRPLIFIGLLILFTFPARYGDAASLPRGISFIGFLDGHWNVYIVQEENAEPRLIKTISEPRAATFNLKKSAVAYIAADGILREVNILTGQDRILLKSNDLQTFTQPSYNKDGTKLLLVLMQNGTSADTEIVLLDIENEKEIVQLTSQPASQFEPHFISDKMIAYSSVSCVLGCGKTIQEIWQKNIITETAEQITLLNTISRQPASTPDKKWLYFSSNKTGMSHIWKVLCSGGKPHQVTEGHSFDLNPIVGEDNRLCFIRKTPSQSNLVCQAPNGKETIMDLSDDIKNIRNLEINVW
jgi:hypothetical protein